MLIKLNIQLYVLLLLALVVGCSIPTTKQQSNLIAVPSWSAQQKNLTQLKTWSFKGKLGYQFYNQDHKPEHGSALVIWQQISHHNYHLDFYGPLNLDNIHVAGTKGLIQLSSANGTKLSGTDPEQLFFDYTGLELPISNLWYWIRGLPVANQKINSLKLNQFNLAEQIEQGDWKIHYLQYKTIQDLNLPNILELTHTNEQIKLKLVIRSWELPYSRIVLDKGF